MSTRTNIKIRSVIVSLVLVTAIPAFAESIIYVDADATGANNGSSWAEAFNYLQDAFAAAWSGDEIRVAQGIYKPDQGVGITPGDRTATFQLKNGVTLKGGYAGFGESDPNAYDIELYETILSGDLAGNDAEVNDLSDLWDEPTRAENSYHVVTASGTDETTVLDGFTITAGNDNRYGPPPAPYYPPLRLGHGAGMYNHSGSPTLANCTFIRNTANSRGGGMCNGEESSPTLTNCIFSENSASAGGAMYTEESSPSLVNCTFNGNLASGFGGGMCNYESEPTLTNCTFSGNSAGNKGSNEGGGMYNWYSSTNITNCTFIGNSAYNRGGAVYIGGISNPTLTNCTFVDNSANSHGGAMVIYYCSPTLINCTFRNNKTGSRRFGGGGILCDSVASPTLINCEFTGNVAQKYGGGMYNKISSSPTLWNCTFIGNSGGNFGGGICNRGNSNPTLTNCIIWGNEAQDGPQIYLASDSYASVNYSDVQGGEQDVYVGPGCALIWGEGNIDADPCFSDPGYWGNREDPNIVVEPNDPNALWVYGDYHLLPDSPCIDSGDPNYTAEPNETDLDGKPRVLDGNEDGISVVDMGAYEYSYGPPMLAEARIVPRTINLASKGKWIGCYIWLPEEYNVADIDPNSILLEDEIQPDRFSVDEQEQVALARFSREQAKAILEAGQAELTISGQLTNGTVFEATDVIRVIDKASRKPAK